MVWYAMLFIQGVRGFMYYSFCATCNECLFLGQDKDIRVFGSEIAVFESVSQLSGTTLRSCPMNFMLFYSLITCS